MARQRWIYRAGTALTLGLVLAGCNGFKAATAKNFTRALKRTTVTMTIACSRVRFVFLTRPAPPAVTADPRKKGLDALADAGLLKSLEDRDIHVKRYELTTYGKRVPPRFCYGHRVVTSIDGFTPPAVVNGQQTTQVDYHYKMMDVPGWADSDQMRKAFPAFAKATSGDAQDRTTLVLTMNGWRVPE